MKTYVYIGAVLAALYGSVLLITQLKGCAHEQTTQAAIEHPATSTQETTHTVTHTIQKPDGVVETTITQDTGKVTDTKPVVPVSGHERITRHGYVSLTGGYDSRNFITENYGVGVGWYFTENLALGARYDRLGEEHRYGVEVTLSF